MNFWRPLIITIAISVVGVIVLIGVAGLKVQASRIEQLEGDIEQIEQEYTEFKRQRKLAYPLAEDNL